MIDFDDFLKVDMRVGRVVAVEDFPEARKPAYKLTIDFGPEIGTKRSSAQITNYPREELEGRLVVAVVNFPPRQIGPFMSEVLTLGASRGGPRDPARARQRRAARRADPLAMGAITHLIAGVPVSDLDAGIDWYTRFFGREPDMRAGNEILWDVDAHATLFIEPDAKRAGTGRITFAVTGLDALLERLAAAGVET